MTKPIINETISADDPTKVSGSVRLYALTGGGGVGYTYAGTPITIGQVIRVSFDANGALKADDGTTALQLNPNVNTSGTNDDAIVTPTGTVWKYTVKYPGEGQPVVRYISVPDGAGPYQVADILTGEPSTLPPPFSLRLDELSDVDTTGVSDGDALVYDAATQTWVDGAGGGGGGVTWESPSTAAEWSAAVTAALARDDNTLYLAPGNHPLPFPSGRVVASSKLKVQGAGVDVCQITITPDSPQVFSVTDDHYAFSAAAGVDFEMADLNVTGPAVVDPEDVSLQTFLFSISSTGSVIVPDSANVTLRFSRIRVNDTSNTNFPFIFQVPNGTGLGRLRMYLEDCDLGRCNAAVAFFGPDSGDRVLYLNRCRFRDSGGYYLSPTYPTYNHTIYIHPSNSVVATDCQFGDNSLGYYIHQFSGGGRVVPNPIDSSFTRCRFGSGTNSFNQDSICTATFDNCDFDGTAPMYLYGTTRFNGCYFDGGDILAYTNPCTIHASRFVAVTDQGRVASGDNVSITDTTFEGGASLGSSTSSSRYRLRDCIFTAPNISLSAGQMDFHNCRMTSFSATRRITFYSASCTVRLFGTDIDASGYAGDHIAGSFAATVSGWGNMVSAGTLAINATIVKTSLGFIQASLTPTSSVDLANKGYVDTAAVLTSTFTAAGGLPAATGSGAYAEVTAPSSDGQVLRYSSGASTKMAWTRLPVSGIDAIPAAAAVGGTVSADAVEFTCNMTTGGSSTTVSSISGWTVAASDVGKSIVVGGAGAAGVDLVTTVATVNTGANTCTVTTGCSTSVTTAKSAKGTDNSAGLAAAIAVALALGIECSLPEGKMLVLTTMYTNGSLAGLAGPRIRGAGRGRSTILWPGSTGTTLLSVSGSETTPATLTGATAVGDVTVTGVPSTSGFTAGDFVVFYDSTQPVIGNDDKTTVTGTGEVARIWAVNSGTSITVDRPLKYAYTTSATIRLWQPALGFSVRDLTFKTISPLTCDYTANLVTPNSVLNFEFRDNEMLNHAGDSIRLQSCVEWRVVNNHFINGYDVEDRTDATPYFVHAARYSCRGYVAGNTARHGRHFFTTTSTSGHPPAAAVEITDNFCADFNHSCIDTHPGARDMFITNNFLDGSDENGIQVRGSGNYIAGNWIANMGSRGVNVVDGADDTVVKDNYIVDCVTGIVIEDSNNCHVVSNHILRPRTAGINILEQAAWSAYMTSCRVEDNFISGTPTVGIDWDIWRTAFVARGNVTTGATTGETGRTINTLASGTGLTITSNSEVFQLTGTTGTTLAAASYSDIGRTVTIIGPSTGTVTVTADADLVLSSTTFVMNQYSTLTLFCNGTQWVEIARTPAISPKMLNGPTGTVWQHPHARDEFVVNERAAQTSGTVSWWAIDLPRGLPISAVQLFSRNTAGASMTHSWCGFADHTTGVVTHISNDDTTAAWGTNSGRTFTFTSRFDVPASKPYRFFFCVVGTTMPTHMGLVPGTSTLSNTASRSSGTSDTGKTTPYAVSDTMAATANANTGVPYLQFT